MVTNPPMAIKQLTTTLLGPRCKRYLPLFDLQKNIFCFQHFYITRVEDIPADLTWKFGSIVEFSRTMAPSVHVWYAAFGVKAHLEVRKMAMSIGLPRLLEADWGRIEM